MRSDNWPCSPLPRLGEGRLFRKEAMNPPIQFSRHLNLLGMRFGWLLVVADAGSAPSGAKGKSRRWVCRCDCGNVTVVSANSLRTNNTRSCGCMFVAAKARRGGLSLTPELQAWRSMIGRCYNPNCAGFENYGGRGITVCERWLGADGHEHFLADMGVKPSPKHSLDRINNGGNYEPSNCRWALRAEQARNTRKTRMISFSGKTMCLMDWAAATGLSHSIIRHRLNRGWSVAAALTEPPDHHANSKERNLTAEAILAAKEKFGTWAAVAEHFGITGTTLCKARRRLRLGIGEDQRDWAWVTAEKLQEAFAEHGSWKAVARAWGCDAAHLYRLLHTHKVSWEREQRDWSYLTADLLEQLLSEHGSWRAAARHLGMPSCQLRGIRRRMGLP